MRSPSPTFSLPPEAAAIASFLALQVSPKVQSKEIERFPKSCIFVDSEAVESASETSETKDILNDESSGDSSVFS